MSQELTRAYKWVKKQWPGLAVRQHQPRNKGWPDFVLVDKYVIFAEVKWLDGYDQMPKPAPMQLHWLNQLHAHGALGIILCAYDDIGHKLGMTDEEGWVAFTGPFTREVNNGNWFWAGKDLKELAIKSIYWHEDKT